MNYYSIFDTKKIDPNNWSLSFRLAYCSLITAKCNKHTVKMYTDLVGYAILKEFGYDELLVNKFEEIQHELKSYLSFETLFEIENKFIDPAVNSSDKYSKINSVRCEIFLRTLYNDWGEFDYLKTLSPIQIHIPEIKSEHNIAVLCMTCDKTPTYLLKAFIEHYRKLNVDIILASTDKLSVPSDVLLINYTEPIHTNNSLITLYNTIFLNIRNKYEWIIIADDDEFLQFDLIKLCNYSDKSCLYIPWTMLGRDLLKMSEDLNGFKEIRMIDQDKNVALKYIANCKKLRQICHVHLGDYKGCFEDNTYLINGKYSRFKSRFLHYYIRSFEEWLDKTIVRGDIVFYGKIPNRKLTEYFYDLDIEYNKDKIMQLVKQCDKEELIPRVLAHLKLCNDL